MSTASAPRPRPIAFRCPLSDDLPDLAGEVVADPRQAVSFSPRAIMPVRLSGRSLDGLGGPAVGAHPERIRLLDLQEIGEPIEDGGDVGVVDSHRERPV